MKDKKPRPIVILSILIQIITLANKTFDGILKSHSKGDYESTENTEYSKIKKNT